VRLEWTTPSYVYSRRRLILYALINHLTEINGRISLQHCFLGVLHSLHCIVGPPPFTVFTTGAQYFPHIVNSRAIYSCASWDLFIILPFWLFLGVLYSSRWGLSLHGDTWCYVGHYLVCLRCVDRCTPLDEPTDFIFVGRLFPCYRFYHYNLVSGIACHKLRTS
jgi:hypothetical protein